MILDAGHVPQFDEITVFIDEPARTLWQDLNNFIRLNYNSSPKIMYSKCSAQPGWNVKYHKSGKSLCTLYPDEKSFIALVVITLDLVPVIEAMSGELETAIIEAVRAAKPFNGTKWLMIPVTGQAVLENIKKLLLLKQKTKKSAKGSG